MFTYDEALNFMLNRQSLGIKPGLSRIKKQLDAISNPQDDIKIIHIAGTNGKGTVAHTIAKALQDNGLKIGLFTSPWIIDYREQIQINGQPISKEEFTTFVSNVFCDLHFGEDLTEFELLVFMMYVHFYKEKVDYAVIECGMGGLEDATNVEKKNISVLTSISLDHTDFLGSTIEEITKQKEGIIRPNCPCFRYESTGNIDRDNLNLAKKVVAYLGYDDDIELVKPIARQQRINGILFDGGHNLEAGKALEPIINNEVAVIGMMRDKDVYGYMSLVAPKCKKIICVTPNNPRAIKADELANIAKGFCKDVQVIEDTSLAIKQDNITLVCGSFYMIREIINSIL